MSTEGPEMFATMLANFSVMKEANGSELSKSEVKKSSHDDRSRSRSRERRKSKEKERTREKDKKKRDRSRERRKSRERSRSRDKDRERHRERSREKKHDRNRDRDRERDRRSSRDRDTKTRSRRSHSRSYDDYDNRRRRRSNSRSRRHDRDRSRSRSHDYRRHERDHHRERDRSRERDYKRDESRLETVREEPRENRFDLTQTIQELMNTTKSTQNFASLFNCTNSNDSYSNEQSENSQDGERKRRKKSRWGGTENDKTFIPGMPTILPSTLDPTQQEAYLVQLQIEEISRKLRTGDLGIPQNPEERSPSPEPIYSSDGKRLNTREFRFRKRLEEQRHQLILKMQNVNPEFKPPADYKPPVTRVSDKVLIPQEEHPDINFVGLLIGPRGNTLKAMEKETGAKIIIRGKGSVKEGKVGRKDGQPLPGEDEPLHAFITAPNPEAVKRAVDKIKDVIRQGIEVPEGHNDLRRMQLRELAQLNGTLRETDCPRCTNCGSTEHKSWLCPDKPNVTNNIICTSCGGAGHIAKDCRSKRPGSGLPGEGTEDSQAKIDEEYLSLMAELGEGPPPTVQKSTVDPLAQAHLNRGYSLFDKKPNTPMQAIQAPPPAPMPIQTQPQPPPLGPPPTMAAPWLPPGLNGSLPAPVMPPPPPIAQPPPPPLMPWLSSAQPPPPGGDSMQPPIPGAGNFTPPPPPGTSSNPLPPMMPPPPGTTAPPLPPWSTGSTGMMSGGFGGWGAGYMPPPPGIAPPPPPCAPPPPGIGVLGQPPPPPPPAT